MVSQDITRSDGTGSTNGIGGNGETILHQPEEKPGVVSPDPDPGPPNGGWKAWAQCAGGFCTQMNTFGLLAAFGVFQSYYETELLLSSSASSISWIGTVQSMLILLGAVYSGPLYDMGFFQPLLISGCFLMVFGMFMTSLGHVYWQLFLAQGVCIGLGLGCLFTPTMGLIASYFTTNRGVAMGITSAGSSIGGIIYPITFHRLVSRVGFGWATRTIAFLMTLTALVSISLMRPRSKPPTVRKIFDLSALRETEFTLFGLSMFVSYAGMFVPFFYIQLFAIDNDIIRGNGELGFYLLPLINATGFVGRIVNGKIADRIGPLNAFIVTSAACTILLLGWIGVTSEAGIIVFCLLYGFFSAGLIALPATVIAITLCPDMRNYGVRMTMQSIPCAIGLLIGNPIAGAIKPYGWGGVQAFAAATVFTSTITAVLSRHAKVGANLGAKC